MKTKTEKLIEKIKFWSEIWEEMEMNSFKWIMKNTFGKWIMKKRENAFNKFWDGTHYTPTISDCVKILPYVPSKEKDDVFLKISTYISKNISEKHLGIRLEECKIIIDNIDKQIISATSTERLWWLDQKKLCKEYWGKLSKQFYEKKHSIEKIKENYPFLEEYTQKLIVEQLVQEFHKKDRYNREFLMRDLKDDENIDLYNHVHRRVHFKPEFSVN
jgi:hypothetical protein